MNDVAAVAFTYVVAVWRLIVTRVAGNDLGPTAGEHVALALRALTGLHTLHLWGT